MTGKEMTLEEFLAEERRRLVAFESYWSTRRSELPGRYPAAMLPGDWDEQLGAYFDGCE